MKKLAVMLFCFFFLISGRILLSIGIDVFTEQVDYQEYACAIDPALFAGTQTEPDEQTSDDPAENDGWDASPFRHLSTIRTGSSGSENVDPDKAGPLNLDAISFGGGLVFAVISGRVLSVGETIGDYTITSISYKEVELLKDGKISRLKLWEEER